jgi:CRP-like cAMP-binding protein
VVDRLPAGQYFGEIGLLHGGTRTASVRAAPETEVELATLSRDDFVELLSESEETRGVIESIQHERLARDQQRDEAMATASGG